MVLILFGVAVLGALIVFFYCPCARLPGGYLLGEAVTTPVADWSFANSVPLCQVEVRVGPLPHSVNLNCMAAGTMLYLSCAGCAGKRWSDAALVHPQARLRLGASVYPVLLARVEDPAELDAAWRARAAKIGQPMATPRLDGWWSFRVTSRE
jgi:hypothetical protein